MPTSELPTSRDSEVGISEENLGIFIADLPGTADAASKSDKHKCSHPFLEQVAGRGWFKVELQGAYLAVFTRPPKPCKRRLLLKTAPIPALFWSIFISLLLLRKPYDGLCSIFLGLCRRVFLFLAAPTLLYLLLSLRNLTISPFCLMIVPINGLRQCAHI